MRWTTLWEKLVAILALVLLLLWALWVLLKE